MADRRLRVLVVSLGRRGGINDYGWLMGRALAARCDIATLISTDADNRERWAQLDAPHLEVRTFNSLMGMIGSFFAFPRFMRIRRFSREFEPDVIYYPGGHAWKPVLDLLLPRSARVVLTLHDPELHLGEDSALHRVLDRSNRLRVDGYVLLNVTQRERFAKSAGVDANRIAVIPLGSLFDAAATEVARLEDVSGFEPVAAHADRYLLFVGRIERYKGLDVLLRAYSQLPVADAPPLVIAGSGEFSAEENLWLADLSDRPVTVVNRWLSEAEIASIVANARFAVLPYTHATQSGVVPLASALGVPSIVSDAGGLIEQVVDGHTGFVFPAGDADALAGVLLRASRMDDVEHARFAEECRSFAHENWDWEAAAGRLLEFLGRV
ncbi:MAG: glycosyltransferase family 4 protein [Actinobacteria bacterium]|nr:glycosyltransferase family 4 protein [Actinomycetota bacterium]MCG2807778.1 glycosyltransferase family 4 protein [Coriobacteriia bacterium]